MSGGDTGLITPKHNHFEHVHGKGTLQSHTGIDTLNSLSQPFLAIGQAGFIPECLEIPDPGDLLDFDSFEEFPEDA